MRLAALLLTVVMIAGCAHTHTTVNAGAGVASGTASGTTTVGGSVSVHGHSNSLAALIFAGLFLAAAMSYREPQPSAPGMATGRRISEQDCTKPIDESSGNLKCR